MLYIIGLATLIVLGLLWVFEIIKRIGRDVNELREGNWADKLAVIVMWIATIPIIAILGWLAWRAVDRIMYYF